MKQSYLLGVLVANLRYTYKFISQSRHDNFRIELVTDNYMSAYDVVRGVAHTDDEDIFVPQDFYARVMSRKMDFYTQKKYTLSKAEYLADINNMIESVIDNTARKGFQMENVDIGVDIGDVDAAQGTPPADGVQDKQEGRPNPSNESYQLIAGILQNIRKDIGEILKILRNTNRGNN